jgi:hypothetical protein
VDLKINLKINSGFKGLHLKHVTVFLKKLNICLRSNWVEKGAMKNYIWLFKFYDANVINYKLINLIERMTIYKC